MFQHLPSPSPEWLVMSVRSRIQGLVRLKTKCDASSVRYSTSSNSMGMKVLDRAKKRITIALDCRIFDLEVTLTVSKEVIVGISRVNLRCVRFVTQPGGTAELPSSTSYSSVAAQCMISRGFRHPCLGPSNPSNLINFGILFAMLFVGFPWNRNGNLEGR